MFKVGQTVESYKNGEAVGATGEIIRIENNEVIVLPNDPLARILNVEAEYSLDGVGIAQPEFTIKVVDQ